MSLPNSTISASILVSSSEAASLHGQQAKTPIIAGSICGGIIALIWLISLAVYFRKRYRRKLRNRGKLPPRKKMEDPEEKLIIPPDPAVLMGHQPGERYVQGRLQSSAAASNLSAKPPPVTVNDAHGLEQNNTEIPLDK